MAKKLLVIEDNPTLNELYVKSFENVGFEVLSAFDSKEGILLAKNNKPDGILLDLLMPSGSGFDVLSELKENPATQDIKVIILTEVLHDEYKELAKKLGAIDYIVKSDTKIEEIVNIVQGHINTL